MKEYQCDPEVRIIGVGLESFLRAFGNYRTRGEKLVCKHFGVETIDLSENVTYPVQLMLNAMKELQEQFGDDMLTRMGAQVPHAALLPNWKSLEEMVGQVNGGYLMNHIAPNPKQLGGYHWNQTSERTGFWLCDNPYPCVFEMGLLRTLVEKFPNKHGTRTTFAHGEGECRSKGGTHCIYRVEW